MRAFEVKNEIRASARRGENAQRMPGKVAICNSQLFKKTLDNFQRLVLEVADVYRDRLYS
jgi:hypothetical protein